MGGQSPERPPARRDALALRPTIKRAFGILLAKDLCKETRTAPGRGPNTPSKGKELLFQMNADVVNGLLNGGDLLGFFIRNFALELFFQSHYQLNGVEGVGAQIVHEGRLDFDFGFVHAQLFGNDLLNARFDVFHLFKPMTFLIRDNKTPVFYKKKLEQPT